MSQRRARDLTPDERAARQRSAAARHAALQRAAAFAYDGTAIVEMGLMDVADTLAPAVDRVVGPASDEQSA